jgi:hypothetical protein
MAGFNNVQGILNRFLIEKVTIGRHVWRSFRRACIVSVAGTLLQIPRAIGETDRAGHGKVRARK